MKKIWTEDKIKKDLLEAIKDLKLSRMPTYYELQKSGYENLAYNITKNKGLNYYADILGIRQIIRGRPWTKEEESFLRENKDKLSKKELMKKLNRTRESIDSKLDYMDRVQAKQKEINKKMNHVPKEIKERIKNLRDSNKFREINTLKEAITIANEIKNIPKEKSFSDLGVEKGKKIKVEIKVERTVKKIEGEITGVYGKFMVVKTQNYDTTISLFALQKSKFLVV